MDEHLRHRGALQEEQADLLGQGRRRGKFICTETFLQADSLFLAEKLRKTGLKFI